MKRKLLLNTEPCPDPEGCDSIKVVAVSQAVYVDGRRILNVDLFWYGRLRARYFADREKEEYGAFICEGSGSRKHNGWTELNIGNAARVVCGKEIYTGYSYYMGNNVVWASEEDKQRAYEILDTYSLESWESDVNNRKYMRAADRKRERINRLMDSIPAVPEAAEEWVKDEIFPGDFLLVRKEKKRCVYSCTHCGVSSWKKIGWKHNEMTICPKCGYKVRVNSRRQAVEKKERVTILQKAGEGQWAERLFNVLCTWDKHGKKVELFAEICAVVKNGEQWGSVYYGERSGADEYEQEWRDRNSISKKWGSSYLWPGNLEEMLPLTGLKNMGLNILAEKKIKFDVNTFIITAAGRPYLEYMIKGGLTKLAVDIVHKYSWHWEPSEDILNKYAVKMTEALYLDGNRANRMKQINGGLDTLEWLQYEKKREDEGSRIKISQEALEWLNQVGLPKGDCEEILQELGSVNRMVNYMKKQKIAPGRLVQTWRDYLRMAREEGLDTEDDIVRLPKDLKARHDELVEVINARNDNVRMKKEKDRYEELNKQIQEHLPEVRRYFWEDDTYIIIPAGKCMELVEEGRELHHCVGSSSIYMAKMAKGESWILFLRKKEDLQKAYYTIEIDMKDDRIMQYYSAYDRQPDKTEISRVLERFRKSIKKNRQQARIQVPVAASA